MLGETILLVAHPFSSHDSQRAVQEQWKAILVAAVRNKHGWSVGFQEGGVFGGTFLLFENFFCCIGVSITSQFGVFKITKVELFFSFPKNAHSLENDDTR